MGNASVLPVTCPASYACSAYARDAPQNRKYAPTTPNAPLATHARCVHTAATVPISSSAHTYTSTINTQFNANRASVNGQNNSVP